eukprot:g24630.t1
MYEALLPLTGSTSDLEKSVDDLQRDSNLNQKLITVQELEEKALVLRQLGETLTELKGTKYPGTDLRSPAPQTVPAPLRASSPLTVPAPLRASSPTD